MSRFQDEVVVITGGSSGIGLATSQRFIEEGAQVVITGRNPERLDSAVARLGDRATGIRGDVSNVEDLDHLFAQVRDRFGRVNVLFANAGFESWNPIEEVTPEDFDSLFATNVRGLFFTVQRALPLMSEGASVILNASINAHIGIPNLSTYSATKAAVRSLGRSLGAELAPRGIRVNVVSPGYIETPEALRDTSPEVAEALRKRFLPLVPMGRTGRVEEIAAVVAFLASDDASYFCGADLVPDGGWIQS